MNKKEARIGPNLKKDKKINVSWSYDSNIVSRST